MIKKCFVILGLLIALSHIAIAETSNTYSFVNRMDFDVIGIHIYYNSPIDKAHIPEITGVTNAKFSIMNHNELDIVFDPLKPNNAVTVIAYSDKIDVKLHPTGYYWIFTDSSLAGATAITEIIPIIYKIITANKDDFNLDYDVDKPNSSTTVDIINKVKIKEINTRTKELTTDPPKTKVFFFGKLENAKNPGQFTARIDPAGIFIEMIVDILPYSDTEIGIGIGPNKAGPSSDLLSLILLAILLVIISINKGDKL